jgi:hypothetical protein
MSFTAIYSGTCRDCDGPIKVGEKIRSSSEGGYAHVECPEEKPADVCKKCFMAKAANGSCECD